MAGRNGSRGPAFGAAAAALGLHLALALLLARLEPAPVPTSVIASEPHAGLVEVEVVSTGAKASPAGPAADSADLPAPSLTPLPQANPIGRGRRAPEPLREERVASGAASPVQTPPQSISGSPFAVPVAGEAAGTDAVAEVAPGSPAEATGPETDAGSGAGAGVGARAGIPGPAGEGGVGTGGNGAGAADISLAEIQRRIADAAVSCYPRAAARFRAKGIARIRFCVGADGAAQDAELLASAGQALLDEAALTCVLQRAAPLPRHPDCLTVPIRFQLAR